MNNVVKLKFVRRNSQLLVFENKKNWGVEINCSPEQYIEEVEEERNPCYWNKGTRAWTYPGLNRFTEAKNSSQWQCVKTVVQASYD